MEQSIPPGHMEQTPAEQAKAVYDREKCARSFTEDVEAHLVAGYVYSTPQYFIMGRAVCSRATYEEITNPWIKFDRESHDSWLVYLVAGKGALRAFLRLEPYELPYYCWERGNKLRYYLREDVHRRLG